MKKLFLLFTAIILVCILGENKKYQLERIDFVSVQRIEFKGLLHIPRSLTFGEDVVNPKTRGVIILHVKQRKFRYVQKYNYNSYFLEQSEILAVNKGDKVRVDFSGANFKGTPDIKLFVERELDK